MIRKFEKKYESFHSSIISDISKSGAKTIIIVLEEIF